MRPQPECPECERLSGVSEKSNIIGEFLDYFLSKKGIYLAKYAEADGWLMDDEGNKNYIDEILVVAREYTGSSGINVLLAEYFGIDLDKVEKERRALLEWLREAHNEQV